MSPIQRNVTNVMPPVVTYCPFIMLKEKHEEFQGLNKEKFPKLYTCVDFQAFLQVPTDFPFLGPIRRNVTPLAHVSLFCVQYKVIENQFEFQKIRG